MARDNHKPPLKGSDKPFRAVDAPWLPSYARMWLHDLTFDEIHAMWLGLMGFPAGYVYATGGRVGQFAAIVSTMVLLAIALFQLPQASGIASDLLSSETWYFSIPYFFLASVGTLVGIHLPIPGVTP